MGSENRTRQGNVELVRRGYEAWNRGELAAVIDLIHPDFQCDVPAGILTAGGARGPQQFERYLAEVSDAFAEFRCELEELRHAGELLVALVREEGRDRDSGAWVRREFFHVWTIRDRKAVRFGRRPRVAARRSSKARA